VLAGSPNRRSERGELGLGVSYPYGPATGWHLWGATMITTFSDPFEALFGLQRALDARLESDWLRDATTSRGPYPPVNVFQQGDGLVAIIELPGVSKNDLEIQAKENTIRIGGKKVINYEQGASVHRRERVSGEFDRTLTLPIQIDPDGIKAEYRDGVLALFAASIAVAFGMLTSCVRRSRLSLTKPSVKRPIHGRTWRNPAEVCARVP
jgi:HSP20 family protein